jgi:hypothetical protein
MAETPVKKAAAKKAPAKPKYENIEYLDKAPSEVHQGFTEWIAATTGHTVPSGDVALVLRLYPLYLKSPAVVAARDLEKAERDRVKAVKEAERKERLQAKLDKIEESRAKLLAELGLEDDAFEEPEPLDETEPEETPVADLAAAKREKARRIAAQAAPEPEPEDDEAAWEGDDDFGDEVATPEGGTVTLEPTDDDEGLWDEDPETANEEEF